MNLHEAITKAKLESMQGYVQHVNLTNGGKSYIVSDWYDSDTTVASYENGRKL